MNEKQSIVSEDLNVNGMKANHKVDKSISE